jgi:hypothetical protein
MAKIRIRNVRLAFPALFEPKAFAGEDKAAYSASFILNGKTDPQVEIGKTVPVLAPDGQPARNAEGEIIYKTDWSQKALLSDVIKSAATEKWGVKGEATLKALKAGDKLFLHDGDSKAQYTGFENNMYISARNPTIRPVVLDRNGKPLAENNGEVYSGCYVHAVLEVYAQDNAFGKRVNATLQTVMFAKDGESFGGGSRGSANDFADLAVEDALDDLS